MGRKPHLEKNCQHIWYITQTQTRQISERMHTVARKENDWQNSSPSTGHQWQRKQSKTQDKTQTGRALSVVVLPDTIALIEQPRVNQLAVHQSKTANHKQPACIQTGKIMNAENIVAKSVCRHQRSHHTDIHSMNISKETVPVAQFE